MIQIAQRNAAHTTRRGSSDLFDLGGEQGVDMGDLLLIARQVSAFPNISDQM